MRNTTKNNFQDLNLMDALKTIADGIAGTFGARCEVVIHDLTDLEHSIVKICNGHVTGRSVGGSITDLGLKQIKSGDFDEAHINYRSETKSGRTLKSSTIILKNDRGKPVIALCINFDVTDILNFNTAIQDIFAISEGSDTSDSAETYEADTGSMLNKMADKAIQSIGKALTSMVKKDRIGVVGKLDEQGFFLIKGAIRILAGKLNVSKFTIYSYLDEIRHNSL